MRSISHDELLAMLADELDAARAQLETLGASLTGDAELAARHITRLQALDHIGQRCTAIAKILRSDDILAASHAASLESIPARLASIPLKLNRIEANQRHR